MLIHLGEMSIKKLLKYLIPVGAYLIFHSCSVDSFSGKLSEGTIEYDMIYLQDEKENPLISLLPTTMTLKIKENNSIQKIEGWMGVFQMAGIAKRDDNYKAAYLKIMGEKYVFETTMDGPSFGFDEYKNMKLEPCDSVKTIAGYKCKAYNVFLNDSAKAAFTIYYTDEIHLDNPNCNNPFQQVKGVLLDYQMNFQKIPVHIQAKKVIKEDIADDEFIVPDGFQKVSKDKIQEVINNLM
ncbi:MAG TPA: hypothetical protein PLP65_09170 [Bacteroidales bacterium]|nr:hypothetical protein [Bacteroidales bacterium]